MKIRLLFRLTAFAVIATSPASSRGEEATPSPVANSAAQAEAMRKHPALGIAGSEFNRAFLARVQRARAETPETFADRAWPLALADEMAKFGSGAILLERRNATAPTGAPSPVQL